MTVYAGEAKKPASRKRAGIILGIVGLVLLFSAGLSLAFVPEALRLAMVALMVVGVVFLVPAYLLVR